MVAANVIQPLRIHDIDFTVARQIEQCPKSMMLRELVVNAIEAASKSEDLTRQLVEIRGKTLAAAGDVRKLVIWNTGPGLSDSELLHICDLSASLRKDMALEGNFGMGAKVASLPSNKLGMRYRSCKSGKVSQVILGCREGVYGKIPQYVDGDYDEIVDVTEQVLEEGEYDLAEDWTEVLLLGNEAEQDTVQDPYNSDPEVDRQWIATGLYHRLYKLPENVTVTLMEGTHPRDGNRPFKTIFGRRDVFDNYECVEASAGIKVHYYFDGPYLNTSHNKSVSGSFASSVSTAGIVYRGEIFDLKQGRKWRADAPIFGIPFGSRHISIHLELPDDFQVRHEPYRRFLQLRGGDQREISLDDFATIVIENRPQWLIDRINEFAPSSSTDTSQLKKDLQRMLNELRIQADSPRQNSQGQQLVESGGARGATPRSAGSNSERGNQRKFDPTDLMFSSAGTKRADLAKNLEQPPDFVELRDEKDIEEHGITGKAASYIESTNTLFLNMRYAAVDDAAKHLETKYISVGDPDVVRSLARQKAEEVFLAKVGYTVIYAKAKQLNRLWTSDEVKSALEPVCLSVSADAWREVIGNVERSMSQHLRAKQGDNEQDLELENLG